MGLVEKKQKMVPRIVLHLEEVSTDADWHKHNGDRNQGWVYKNAVVDKTAHVGLEAVVYGNAQVFGKAKAWTRSCFSKG